MKDNIRHTLVAKISLANFLHETKPYCDQYCHPATNRDMQTTLTHKGKQAIDKYVWRCYVPDSKLGKNSRYIDSEEVSTLLQSVKHIDDIHLIPYYKNLPHADLEYTFVTIVFFNYINDRVTEKLQRALYIKSITKEGAKNGSVDALALEVSLKSSIKKDEKISDYIEKKGKHPLISFLGINSRTIKSYGGNKNAK